MFGGYTSRTRIHLFEELTRKSILARLYGRIDINPKFITRERTNAMLQEYRVRFVISVDAQYDEMFAKLGMQPEFSSPNFRVYRIKSAN